MRRWLTSWTSTGCSHDFGSGQPRSEIVPSPPVAGPDRQRFVEQAQLDYQDYALVSDATWEFADGVLTLRIDMTPSG
ncbi:MAG TPA: hypothetical protein VFF40_13945 [Acidimicrobiia bacterium]|nr:hypothetical protein [Acidimicrobiia bacterium]